MGWRALMVGFLVTLASCTSDQNSSGDGGDGRASEDKTGGASTRGGSGGSENGGTSQGGDAGAEQGGSSGTSPSGTGEGGTSQSGAGQGGTAVEQGGSAGDGVAAAGGQDTGAGTVTGVVTTESGSPNENVFIVIGSATTWTDEDGRFEIPNVAPEYDLALLVPTERYALVIRGASARTLELSAPGDEDVHGGNVFGVVTGGVGTPIPDDCYARAVYQGSNADVTALFGPDVLLSSDDASYGMDLIWLGPAESVSGFLYALEHRVDAMRRVISYDGFGSTRLDIVDRNTYGMQDGSTPETTIALAPVASRTVTGTVTVPQGYFPSLQFSVGPFDTDAIHGPPGTYSTLLPTGLQGLRNAVTLRAGRAGEGLAEESSYAMYPIDDDVTTLDLSTPAAALSILPETGAVVDYDTQFSWEPPADSVSFTLFQLGQWTVWVLIDASSTTIPDLSEYGVTPDPNYESYWWVDNVIGPSSVDEWLRFDPAAHLATEGKLVSTTGFERTFTFAN